MPATTRSSTEHRHAAAGNDAPTAGGQIGRRSDALRSHPHESTDTGTPALRSALIAALQTASTECGLITHAAIAAVIGPAALGLPPVRWYRGDDTHDLFGVPSGCVTDAEALAAVGAWMAAFPTSTWTVRSATVPRIAAYVYADIAVGDLAVELDWVCVQVSATAASVKLAEAVAAR